MYLCTLVYGTILIAGGVTLHDLVIELEEVVDWFLLGVHLEVRDSDLMAIKETHLLSRDVNGSKIDLFTTWLRTSHHPKWFSVVRALMGIRMEALARKLAVKHGKSILHTDRHHSCKYNLHTV